MKFSETWLREWSDPAISSEQLAAQLTLLGLEVDALESAAAEFTHVYTARIESLTAHPDAEKLQICTVFAGAKGRFQVVCGAPNVHVGMMAPLALVGARLPNGLEIKAAKLRGVDSQGMLCSEKELGLSEQGGGLMSLASDAEPGIDLREFLQLDDTLIEIDLTPNRGDCLSIRGIARELAAKNRIPLQAVRIAESVVAHQRTLPVTLSYPAGCPRYTGRVITHINAGVRSPQWLQEKLRRSGIRSISPTVDVTNYVMLELGQPMHAYDLDCLHGGIDVRLSRSGETLTLLDGNEHRFETDSLLIADAHGPVGIAGIMGGLSSAVSAETCNIFLESAFFTPQALAGKARRYGLNTDSAYRFERGVDPQGQRQALERATALLLEIVGGQAGPVVETVVEAQLPSLPEIRLRAARIERLLGVSISAAEVEEILRSLGMQVLPAEQHEWRVVPSSWRFDLRIEADLIEELARLRGYNLLQRTAPAMEPVIRPADTGLNKDRVRSLMVDRGYDEAITYSFVDQKLQQLLDTEHQPLSLVNPISSDLAVMRTGLWPGLLSATIRNFNRQQTRVCLFEIGMVFIPEKNGELRQEVRLGGIRSGSANVEQWGVTQRPVDFFDIKADVEAILGLAAQDQLHFQAAEHEALHPGQSARILLQGAEIGWLGRIHPELELALDLPQSALMFELRLAALNAKEKAKFAEISRFPSIRHDISVILDASVSADAVIETVKSAAPASLKEVILFDVYLGEGLGFGRKSVALGLILQDLSRTLTEKEVDEIKGRVLASLQKNLGATLRES